jgi:hypothetical protein
VQSVLDGQLQAVDGWQAELKRVVHRARTRQRSAAKQEERVKAAEKLLRDLKKGQGLTVLQKVRAAQFLGHGFSMSTSSRRSVTGCWQTVQSGPCLGGFQSVWKARVPTVGCMSACLPSTPPHHVLLPPLLLLPPYPHTLCCMRRCRRCWAQTGKARG